ncbi:MAG: lasso peptide biosynthesis B2 protein [Brevundimonas sp.]
MSKALIAVALTGTTLLLRAFGMRRSVGILWWMSARSSASPPAIPAERFADRQAQVIAMVADRLPFRPTCLPRALVLAALLRRRQLQADLCVGARVAGEFDAHAWIEVGGRPIRQEADLNETFRCLWRLPTVRP